MHDLGALAVPDGYRDDEVGALDDRVEVENLVQSGNRVQACRPFPAYHVAIALGIHLWLAGTVASASMPMATSARLHAAIAWKAPRWFRTPRHFGARTSQRPGSSAVTPGERGREVWNPQAHAEREQREPESVAW